MALQKNPLNISFAQGLDTKTDPYQVQLGKFLNLTNSVFTIAGRLTKRNGYKNLTSLGNANQTTLMTLNDNLIATGTNLFAYSAATNQWLNQGLIQPVRLNTLSMVRSNTSQVSPDAAITPSGLACVVYMDSGASYYQISDNVTGQQIKTRTLIPNSGINPRVLSMGVYFIITFIADLSGTPTLQYMAIPTANPAFTGVPTNISASVNGFDAGYDAVTANNRVYFAWASPTDAVSIAFLTPSLLISTPVVLAGIGHVALISITADNVNAMIWVSYWEDDTFNSYTAAFNFSMVPLVAQTQFITTTEIAELTSSANSGVNSIFYENINTYTYDTDIRTDFISTVEVAPPLSGIGVGIVGATTIILRSVGLASKAFIDPITNKIYMMVAYGDEHQSSVSDNSAQPTYFLMDSLGALYMRLAYSNGGGYAVSQVLPSVVLFNDTYYVPYLITDFLTTTNKGTNLPSGTPTSPIYTQTGINLAEFRLIPSNQHSSEIAGALHLTGGQLWEYDGVRPVEHGFHVWPENIEGDGGQTLAQMIASTYFYVFTYEWTDNAGNLHRSAPSIPITVALLPTPPVFTATTTTGSPILTAVSSFTGLQVGQEVVSGSNIPPFSTIISLDPGAATITLSMNAFGSGTTSVTLNRATSVGINVPTLRLTYKISPNPVRIVGYRFTAAQPIYYQFTSVTAPIVNNTAVDFVTITDTKIDAEILGNAILYTTGGVIENIAPPASIASALFNNRLFLIDAEDQNLLWFSKQVIQNVPVEMSDLLTLYVAPTTGAQGSTGPMTALSAMDDKLIIFKKDAIYYINGNGPDNTGSNSTFSDPVFITATVGCDNPSSIVLMPNGIMFQSDKGIWLLGRGLDTTYIGAPVETYNNQVVMSATAIPGTNQVRFILDNNITLMYDYFFNQWGTHTNIEAISATLYQGSHTYLNNLGQVFQETQGLYRDGSVPVLMSLTTSWCNLAGVQGLERFYFANLLGTYYTPFKLNVTLAYNYNPSPVQSIIVTPDNFGGTWGSQALWGSGGSWGGSEGNVFTARLFPKNQKCQSFQVSIQEVYDPGLGVEAGQGLSLSGLALVVGTKRGYRTQSSRKSFG